MQMSKAAPSGRPNTDLPLLRASISGRSVSSSQSMRSSDCLRRNWARLSAFSFRSCLLSLESTHSLLDMRVDGGGVLMCLGVTVIVVPNEDAFPIGPLCDAPTAQRGAIPLMGRLALRRTPVLPLRDPHLQQPLFTLPLRLFLRCGKPARAHPLKFVPRHFFFVAFFVTSSAAYSSAFFPIHFSNGF